jgi:archaellum component FlaC
MFFFLCVLDPPRIVNEQDDDSLIYVKPGKENIEIGFEEIIIKSLLNISMRLDNVDKRLDNVDSRMAKLEEGQTNISIKLENVENRLENVENRLENVENRLENVDNRLENVEDRLENVENRLENVEDRLENVEDRLENVENRLENVENRLENVENRLENVENRLENVDNRLENVENRLENVEEDTSQISGKYAIRASDLSSGIICAKTPNNSIDCGLGNLIKWQDRLFFSTCLHVIYDESLMKFRIINAILLHDDTALELIPTGEVIVDKSTELFNESSNSAAVKLQPKDFALIEIQNSTRYNRYAANISQTPLKLSDFIRGVVYFVKGKTYVEGTIQETVHDGYTFQSNVGGVPGFSGGGYFNNKGELQAIHRGDGCFFGESFLQQASIDSKKVTPVLEALNNTFNACFKENNTVECLKEFYKTTNLISRNPRSEVMDASYLNKLLDKNSKSQKVCRIQYDNHIIK